MSPVTADGVMPFARWVIRQRGRPEVGNLACSMCHTRVMPDGTALPGAQGNFPFDWSFARDLPTLPLSAARRVMHQMLAAPWVNAKPIGEMSRDDLVAALIRYHPSGVLLADRELVSASPLAKIPDLIGVRDRRYLDATGFVRHRDIGDLMRTLRPTRRSTCWRDTVTSFRLALRAASGPGPDGRVLSDGRPVQRRSALRAVSLIRMRSTLPPILTL